MIDAGAKVTKLEGNDSAIYGAVETGNDSVVELLLKTMVNDEKLRKDILVLKHAQGGLDTLGEALKQVTSGEAHIDRARAQKVVEMLFATSCFVERAQAELDRVLQEFVDRAQPKATRRKLLDSYGKADFEIVVLLVKKGASIKRKFLIAFVKSGNVEISSLLIEHLENKAAMKTDLELLEVAPETKSIAFLKLFLAHDFIISEATIRFCINVVFMPTEFII